MRYLSLCAIVQNEGLYIKEWLDFHIAQGVEHFYIYNNDSTDNTSRVLLSYRESGLVTYYKISGLRKQQAAYDHCIEMHRKDTVWCVFIDVDEFMYAVGTVRAVVSQYYDDRRVSAVVACWLNFGSSGHVAYSPEPVRERFTHRRGILRKVKSIVRMQDCNFMITPHSFCVRGYVIDEHYVQRCKEHKEGRIYPQDCGWTSDILKLNHYITKSKEECELRRKGVRADTGLVYAEDFFTENDRNEIEDREILENGYYRNTNRENSQ